MSNLILALNHYDRRILMALLVRRRPHLDTLMRVLTHMGGWYSVLPIAISLAYWAPPVLGNAGALSLWAVISSHLVVQLLKRSICRERPRMPVGLGFLVEPEDRFSFPSGHSAAGLALTLPLSAAIGGPLGVLIVLIGAGIGISRCYLGVHYPGDVVVGWTLGVVGVVSGALIGLPL